ncbi:MAG: arginine N-succinyltransferase, partial [Oceanococcaceae bacterium]
HYHLSKVVHSSRELNIYNMVDVLTLCNDYTGATELCTLFLTPAARARHNGHLLSRSRFLFMAEHPQRFADIAIAELRGVSDEQGRSPFWTWLQKHFFSMDLADAIHRVGMGQKAFIAELMPHYPVYVSLLDPAAQAVIGEVHPQTRPARRLLEKEGFIFGGYVDPFDAGPSVECRSADIRSVRRSQRYALVASNGLGDRAVPMLIANTGVADFCATVAQARINADTDTLCVDAEVLKALNLENGAPVRAVAL